jgi:hypothetical protein
LPRYGPSEKKHVMGDPTRTSIFLGQVDSILRSSLTTRLATCAGLVIASWLPGPPQPATTMLVASAAIIERYFTEELLAKNGVRLSEIMEAT